MSLDPNPATARHPLSRTTVLRLLTNRAGSDRHPGARPRRLARAARRLAASAAAAVVALGKATAARAQSAARRPRPLPCRSHDARREGRADDGRRAGDPAPGAGAAGAAAGRVGGGRPRAADDSCRGRVDRADREERLVRRQSQLAHPVAILASCPRAAPTRALAGRGRAVRPNTAARRARGTRAKRRHRRRFTSTASDSDRFLRHPSDRVECVPLGDEMAVVRFFLPRRARRGGRTAMSFRRSPPRSRLPANARCPVVFAGALECGARAAVSRFRSALR